MIIPLKFLTIQRSRKLVMWRITVKLVMKRLTHSLLLDIQQSLYGIPITAFYQLQVACICPIL